MIKGRITGGLGHGWDGGFDDGRLDAPSYHRNADVIGAALERHLTAETGDVVEIGSGSGQHVVTYAGMFPDLTWHPSDPDVSHRRSVDAWRAVTGASNVMSARNIDACVVPWSGMSELQNLIGILCINVVHIAPWRVACGLFRDGGSHLAPEGVLVLYGPFKRSGAHTASSNAAFDAQLRGRNPEWGIRDVGELETEARLHGLELAEVTAVPSNNLIVVFKRRDT